MITCPDSDIKVDYYSRKQKYMGNTQAVVGADLVFQDAATGFADSVHNFFHFFFTSFKEHIIIRRSRKRDILGSPQELINGFLVRPLILSDGAYPPTAWQVRPYSFNLNLSDTEKSSNKHLSLARATVKRAFGVLKGR